MSLRNGPTLLLEDGTRHCEFLLEGKTGDPEGKRWDRSPGIVALLVFSAALILAAGLAGPRLEQVFQTALGVR